MENRRLKAVVEHYSRTSLAADLIGKSPATVSVLKRIEKVAEASDTTILLEGESGVGKEVAARLIHKLSRPAASPFVAVNCGGIAESLLESELFGREKGAYTGADKMAPGIFEMAAGGTVLLDEISEMSNHAQSRFLRVLEDRTVRRLGGVKEISIGNTRVIAATNRNLKGMVEDGEFRKDLYYRIAVAPIIIPPLRERKADILPLANHFLQQFHATYKKNFYLSADAESSLLEYDFPGNARELRNMIEHAVIFAASEEIRPSDFGLARGPSVADASKGTYDSGDSSVLATGLNLAQNESRIIRNAVAQNPGNHSAAARQLGITPQALYRKLEKHKIDELD